MSGTGLILFMKVSQLKRKSETEARNRQGCFIVLSGRLTFGAKFLRFYFTPIFICLHNDNLISSNRLDIEIWFSYFVRSKFLRTNLRPTLILHSWLWLWLNSVFSGDAECSIPIPIEEYHGSFNEWKVESSFPIPPLLWFSRWFALIAKTARNSWNPSLRKRNSRLHKSNHNFSFHCATAIHSFLLPLLLLSFHSFWLFLQTNIFQLNYSISADGIGSNLERSSFQIVHFNPITNLHPSIIDSQFQMKRIVFFSRRKNCMNLELYGYYWKHKRER